MIDILNIGNTLVKVDTGVRKKSPVRVNARIADTSDTVWTLLAKGVSSVPGAEVITLGGVRPSGWAPQSKPTILSGNIS